MLSFFLLLYILLTMIIAIVYTIYIAEINSDPIDILFVSVLWPVMVTEILIKKFLQMTVRKDETKHYEAKGVQKGDLRQFPYFYDRKINIMKLFVQIFKDNKLQYITPMNSISSGNLKSSLEEISDKVFWYKTIYNPKIQTWVFASNYFLEKYNLRTRRKFINRLYFIQKIIQPINDLIFIRWR